MRSDGGVNRTTGIGLKSIEVGANFIDRRRYLQPRHEVTEVFGDDDSAYKQQQLAKLDRRP